MAFSVGLGIIGCESQVAITEKSLALWCLLDEPDGGPAFNVNVPLSTTVDGFVSIVKTRVAPLLDTIPYHTLVLSKVSESVLLAPSETLGPRISELVEQSGSMVLCKLTEPSDRLSLHFDPDKLGDNKLHVLVKKPNGYRSSDEPPHKRRKTDDGKSSTPEDSPRMPEEVSCGWKARRTLHLQLPIRENFRTRF